MSNPVPKNPAPKKIVQLPESPSLSGLYANALKATALGAIGLAKRAKTFPDTEYRVSGLTPDPAKLDGFNRLLHGAGRDSVPAGFVHIMSFPIAVGLMGAKDFPVPLMGLVHLTNSIDQFRQINPAEPLDFRVRVQNPGTHRAGTQFEIEAEVRAAGTEELLWQGLSTYLARGVKLGFPEVADERDSFEAPEPNAIWPLGADTGRRYGAVSGDINPIHTSSMGARVLGMKSSIAHGMYLASRALTSALPAGVEAFRWEAAFATPTFIPGTVAVSIKDIGEPWRRTENVGWNSRNGKKHFSGSVSPL